jgi:hypothetical protein
VPPIHSKKIIGKNTKLSWGPMWVTGCAWWVVVVLICKAAVD